MVEFQYGGQRRSLNPGGHFARPRDAGFRDTPATELEAMVAEIEAGRPWREVVHDHFATPRPWLHAIISDPRRTGFWAVVPGPDDRPGPALDIGAGWGQIARPLAAHRPVVALEPVAERMAFIRAAARQDGVADHLAFIEADYLEVDFVTPFALICAIGVLLPYSQFAHALNLVALPYQYWLALTAILLTYMGLTQLVKTWLIRRFGLG